MIILLYYVLCLSLVSYTTLFPMASIALMRERERSTNKKRENNNSQPSPVTKKTKLRPFIVEDLEQVLADIDRYEQCLKLREEFCNHSALHYAVAAGREEVVEILLRNGEEVNAKDIDGKSPLHLAALINNLPIARRLIAAGANVNCKSNSLLTTPLHIAAHHGYKKMVALLLQHNAKVRSRNPKGPTPLHVAKNDQIRDILMEALYPNIEVKTK